MEVTYLGSYLVYYLDMPQREFSLYQGEDIAA